MVFRKHDDRRDLIVSVARLLGEDVEYIRHRGLHVLEIDDDEPDVVDLAALTNAGWPPNSRPPLPASSGLRSSQSILGHAAVISTAMPPMIQTSRRVAATMFRWMLPTRPPMATDGKVGPPGRSPRGLFRLVHNWN